jgi:uncharacterized protein
LKAAVLDEITSRMTENAIPAWSETLQEAFEQFLSSESRTLRVATLPLAFRWDQKKTLDSELKQALKQLVEGLKDTGQREEDRVQLIGSLMNVPGLQQEMIAELGDVLSAGASPALQRKIIEELGQTTLPESGTLLAGRYPQLSGEVKQLAFSTLLKRQAWALALLNALQQESISVADLGVQGASRLRTHADPVVAQKAAAILDAVQGPQIAEKQALIEQFTPALRGQANIDNGRALFQQNCAVCHKFGNDGVDFGPDVTGVGVHGPLVLLTHILDPNRVVEGNFIPYDVTTRKQEEYSGLLVREDRNTVVLRNLEGTVEIRRDEIARMVSSGRSLMPEGMEALGEAAIRDIVGYMIQSTGKGFRALDLGKAFTADSRKGLYAEQSDKPSLPVKKFGVVMVEGVPFHLVNPENNHGKNVVVLKGGTGFAQTHPRRVEFPVGTSARKIHVLGGVAGWGYPYGATEGHDLPAARVKLVYNDNQTEEIVLRNGREFADYVREIEVPGSRPASGLVSSGQLRWFTLTPRRAAEIRSIVLESFDNHLAPTFMAMTAQLEE